MFIITAQVGKKREIHNLDGVTVEITLIKISGDTVQFGIKSRKECGYVKTDLMMLKRQAD